MQFKKDLIADLKLQLQSLEFQTAKATVTMPQIPRFKIWKDATVYSDHLA